MKKIPKETHHLLLNKIPTQLPESHGGAIWIWRLVPAQVKQGIPPPPLSLLMDAPSS